jgi:23S rRNA (uracil1939-C5)-methyltransferase
LRIGWVVLTLGFNIKITNNCTNFMQNKNKKRKIVENVLIQDFAAEGKCIARLDNAVVFIEGDAAPGDVVDIEIYKQKKSFFEARVIRTHSLSDKRTDTFCSYFGVCGGCKWQHISYDEQLKFKWQQVYDHLHRIAKVSLPTIEPIVPSAQKQYYRNKLEFTFSNARWLLDRDIASGQELSRDALGFHIPKRFDRILDIDQCYLQPDPSNRIRNAVRDFARQQGLVFYDQRKNEGFLRNLIIRTANSGDVMVVVQFATHDMEAINQVMTFLTETFTEITSLHYIINTKGNDSYQDQTAVHWAGKTYIEETMEDLTFRVGPKSFFQTNASQAYELYKITRAFAELTGHERVYDLYTGTGTIANFVAKQAAEVVGVEYVTEAIDDAKINADINNISNTRFFAGDMKRILNDEFIAANGHPDVIITDPPRAGMDEPVVRKILEIAPDRVVYVSCNTATQARDLAILDQKYDVARVCPVDMFPHTHHVENVVLLRLRK